MQSRSFNHRAGLTAAIVSAAVIGTAMLIATPPAHAGRVLPKPAPSPTCQWDLSGTLPVLRCGAV